MTPRSFDRPSSTIFGQFLAKTSQMRDAKFLKKPTQGPLKGRLRVRKISNDVKAVQFW